MRELLHDERVILDDEVVRGFADKTSYAVQIIPVDPQIPTIVRGSSVVC